MKIKERLILQQKNEELTESTEFDYSKAQNKFLDQIKENLKLNSSTLESKVSLTATTNSSTSTPVSIKNGGQIGTENENSAADALGLNDSTDAPV
jgi:hypothetical protein